jgi:hypothetical protein
MTPADILCRCCGKDYSVNEGCGICEPAKRNVVWPAMQESVAADLVGVSRRVVRLLDSQAKALQRDLDSSMGGYNASLAREASQLARAIAATLTEARKLEEREEAKVKGTGFDGQLDIFLEWLAGLPREYQHRALGGMEKLLLPAPAEAELDD